MRRCAVFRFDASCKLGGGHAYRCLTLAQALARVGWRVVVAASSETFQVVPAVDRFKSIIVSGGADDEIAAIGAAVGSAELLVVDHYDRDAVFESKARSLFQRILVIDDLADRHHDADLLLDQSYGRTSDEYTGLVPRSCRLLVGTAYALLRPEFTEMRARALARRTGELGHIMVSFGLTDLDNMTARVLNGLRDIAVPWTADVILGSAAPHIEDMRAFADEFAGRVRVLVGVNDMAALMSRADLAIGATGTTSWERCCLGLPSLAVVLADNQRRIASELASAGAIELMNVDPPEAIRYSVEGLAASPARMREMSRVAAAICDGKGTHRVVDVLQQ